MGEKSGTSVEDLRAKFDNLRIQKEETEKADADKAAEEQKKFEDHEQVISANPVEAATGNLTYWWPEDEQFWKRWGWQIAGPNIIWSTCNLFLMFAVFIHWSAVVNGVAVAHAVGLSRNEEVYMFGFEKDIEGQKDYLIQAQMIVPLAAFAGATQRGVQCWMTVITGGRVHNTMNTVFVCVPMILASIFLSMADCPFIAIWLVAILSGVAGGAFSSSLNNISYFFPKRQQGLALGIVAGLANLGEALAYGVAPLIVDVGICAAGEQGDCDAKDFGGKYPFNLGVFWTVLLVVVAIPSWLKMNSAPDHGSDRGAGRSITRFFQLAAVGWLWSLAIGVVWMLTEISVADRMILLLIRLIGFSVLCFVLLQGSLYYLSPAGLKYKLRPQMTMMRTKDIWFMAAIYTAAFGTLMAWCVAFPAVIGAVFNKMPDPPKVDDFAWIGPFVGGLSRVLGGHLADKYGGSTITMWSLILLIIASILATVVVILAVELDDPTANFAPYVLVIVAVLFFAGMSSGSVFRQIGFLYPPESRGPALGFVTCVASYCAAVIIILLVQGIIHDVHIASFCVIIVFYIPVVVINWWFYKRAASQNQC